MMYQFYKANSLIHSPSLVSMWCVACKLLKDRQALIWMLKKRKKKQVAQSCNVGSESVESLDAKPYSIHLALIGEIGLLCVTAILNCLEYLEGYYT